jgi:hypothetical protein
MRTVANANIKQIAMRQLIDLHAQSDFLWSQEKINYGIKDSESVIKRTGLTAHIDLLY